MAVLKLLTDTGLIAVGGPGTPAPSGGASVDVPNTWTADQTFTGKLLPVGDGASSVKIGNILPANASGSSCVAIGTGAVATQTNAIAILGTATGTSFPIAIGVSAVATGNTQCVAVGRFAQALGTSTVALGGGAKASAAFSMALGYSSEVVGAGDTGGTAIGYNASASCTTFSNPTLAVGYEATATEGRAVALGPSAQATGISSTAVGRGARAHSTHGISIGRGSWLASDLGGDAAIGSNGSMDLWLASGHTHKWDDPIDTVTIDTVPTNCPITIHGFDAYDSTATPTNNVAGGALILMAGRGTGTAVGGSVKLQVAPAGAASNNVKNAAVSVVECGVIGNASALAYFGGALAVKQSVEPAATDLTTALALVNSMRDALIAYSLVA